MDGLRPIRGRQIDRGVLRALSNNPVRMHSRTFGTRAAASEAASEQKFPGIIGALGQPPKHMRVPPLLNESSDTSHAHTHVLIEHPRISRRLALPTQGPPGCPQPEAAHENGRTRPTVHDREWAKHGPPVPAWQAGPIFLGSIEIGFLIGGSRPMTTDPGRARRPKTPDR